MNRAYYIQKEIIKCQDYLREKGGQFIGFKFTNSGDIHSEIWDFDGFYNIAFFSKFNRLLIFKKMDLLITIDIKLEDLIAFIVKI